MKVRCKICGSVFEGYVPKGGDGTGLIPYRHKRKNSDEIFIYVWCDGRFYVGETVQP